MQNGYNRVWHLTGGFLLFYPQLDLGDALNAALTCSPFCLPYNPNSGTISHSCECSTWPVAETRSMCVAETAFWLPSRTPLSSLCLGSKRVCKCVTILLLNEYLSYLCRQLLIVSALTSIALFHCFHNLPSFFILLHIIWIIFPRANLIIFLKKKVVIGFTQIIDTKFKPSCLGLRLHYDKTLTYLFDIMAHDLPNIHL